MFFNYYIHIGADDTTNQRFYIDDVVIKR